MTETPMAPDEALEWLRQYQQWTVPAGATGAHAAAEVLNKVGCALAAEVERLRVALAARPTRPEVLREEMANLRRIEREDTPEGALGTRTGLLRAALILDERAEAAERVDAGKDSPTGAGSTRADSCACCSRPFDPSDTRWDGHARHRDTPWCRSCVDRCVDTTDAFHRCPICRAAEGGDA